MPIPIPLSHHRPRDPEITQTFYMSPSKNRCTEKLAMREDRIYLPVRTTRNRYIGIRKFMTLCKSLDVNMGEK